MTRHCSFSGLQSSEKIDEWLDATGRRLGVANELVVFDRVDETLAALQGLTALRLNGCYYSDPELGRRVRLPAQLSCLQGLRSLALEVRLPAPYGRCVLHQIAWIRASVHYSIFDTLSSLLDPFPGILKFYLSVCPDVVVALALFAPASYVGEMPFHLRRACSTCPLRQLLSTASRRWHHLGATLLIDVHHVTEPGLPSVILFSG